MSRKESIAAFNTEITKSLQTVDPGGSLFLMPSSGDYGQSCKRTPGKATGLSYGGPAG